MVTHYVSTREKIILRVLPILKSKSLNVDKKFFISSLSLELSVKATILEEVIKYAIDSEIIKEENGFLISNLSKEDMLKSDAEREAENEFKKLGI